MDERRFEDLRIPGYRERVLAKIAAAPVPSPEDVLRVRELIARSGRHNGDLRGNNVSRRRRTQRLLGEFGDGTTCPCAYCGRALVVGTLTQDKIFPGTAGGRYVFANLLPACLTCNSRRRDADVREFITECEAALELARSLLTEER